MTIHCPACGKTFDKEFFPLGSTVACPFCGTSFDIASRETLKVNGHGPDGNAPDSPEPPGPDVKNREARAQANLPGDAADSGTAPEADSPAAPAAGAGGPGAGHGAGRGLKSGDRLSGFKLVREVGRGGMGVVFEGVQESLNRKVAIKVLPAHLSGDQQFVGRFEREARSLANLSHPNIVGVIDKGFDAGHYFFVMEFVNGVSLRDLVDRGEMTPERALKLVGPICDALEYAHSQGVVHRDIKPANILLDEQGRVKIADFGLARIVRGDRRDDGLSRSNLVMGTPDYMAPEQRNNPKDVDHRADIFSLGVVIYELLTGSLPVGRFDPPSRSARVDVRLDQVVLKALENDRELRFQNASEIASAVSRITSVAQAGAAPAAPAGPPPRGEKPSDAEFPIAPGGRINVQTGDANVVLRLVDGPARVSGSAAFSAARVKNDLSVTVADGAGALEIGAPRGIAVSVTTGAGSVSARKFEGRLTAATGDGNVTIEDFTGSLRLSSGNGHCTLRRVDLSDLLVETGNGDVLVDGLALSQGSGRIAAGNGSARINVAPERCSFRYTLESGTGEVLSAFDRTVGHRADGAIGAGAATLQVQTGTGGCTLDYYGNRARFSASVRLGEKRRGAGWAAFFQHLGVFAVINAGLFALNKVTSPEYTWMAWVAIPWGIGLGLQFWSTLVRTFMGHSVPAHPNPREFSRAVSQYFNVRGWTSFGRHLGAFLAVNGFLAFLNWYTTPSGPWWFVWPAGAWGIGIGIHFWTMFVSWIQNLWSGEERRPQPTLEALEAGQSGVSAKWSSFFQGLGPYTIVNSGLMLLDWHFSGRLSWSPIVLAAWSIPQFISFWSAALNTLELISLEKLGRANLDRGAVPPTFSLLPPLLFTVSILAAAALLWAVPAGAGSGISIEGGPVSFSADASFLQGHAAGFFGAVLAILALGNAFYFGLGPSRLSSAVYVGIALLILAWCAVALFASATVHTVTYDGAVNSLL